MVSKNESLPQATSFPAIASHPDFQLPWIQNILNNPNIEFVSELPAGKEHVHNSLFDETLAHPTGLRARLFFRRPFQQPSSLNPPPAKYEECLLASLGTALNGAAGRAHGGLSSVLLDHLTGTGAQREMGSTLPTATARLEVDYVSPVKTPGVVLVRAWVESVQGRKVWTRGVIVNGEGGVCARARGLFIVPRDGSGSGRL